MPGITATSDTPFLCRPYARADNTLSNLHALKAPNGGLVKPPRVSAMNDVFFLLLGLGGMAALYGYAAFCNRH